jgi:hypothetical protein
MVCIFGQQYRSFKKIKNSIKVNLNFNSCLHRIILNMKKDILNYFNRNSNYIDIRQDLELSISNRKYIYQTCI